MMPKPKLMPKTGFGPVLAAAKLVKPAMPAPMRPVSRSKGPPPPVAKKTPPSAGKSEPEPATTFKPASDTPSLKKLAAQTVPPPPAARQRDYAKAILDQNHAPTELRLSEGDGGVVSAKGVDGWRTGRLPLVVGLAGAGRVSQYGNFDIISGSESPCLSSPPDPALTVRHALLGACACRVLTAACNPMICPISHRSRKDAPGVVGILPGSYVELVDEGAGKRPVYMYKTNENLESADDVDDDVVQLQHLQHLQGVRASIEQDGAKVVKPTRPLAGSNTKNSMGVSEERSVENVGTKDGISNVQQAESLPAHHLALVSESESLEAKKPAPPTKPKPPPVKSKPRSALIKVENSDVTKAATQFEMVSVSAEAETVNNAAEAERAAEAGADAIKLDAQATKEADDSEKLRVEAELAESKAEVQAMKAEAKQLKAEAECAKAEAEAEKSLARAEISAALEATAQAELLKAEAEAATATAEAETAAAKAVADAAKDKLESIAQEKEKAEAEVVRVTVKAEKVHVAPNTPKVRRQSSVTSVSEKAASAEPAKAVRVNGDDSHNASNDERLQPVAITEKQQPATEAEVARIAKPQRFDADGEAAHSTGQQRADEAPRVDEQQPDNDDELTFGCTDADFGFSDCFSDSEEDGEDQLPAAVTHVSNARSLGFIDAFSDEEEDGEDRMPTGKGQAAVPLSIHETLLTKICPDSTANEEEEATTLSKARCNVGGSNCLDSGDDIEDSTTPHIYFELGAIKGYTLTSEASVARKSSGYSGFGDLTPTTGSDANKQPTMGRKSSTLSGFADWCTERATDCLPEEDGRNEDYEYIIVSGLDDDAAMTATEHQLTGSVSTVTATMSGAIGVQEDTDGNFSATGRQFMGSAQISSNDLRIEDSDNGEEDAASLEEMTPLRACNDEQSQPASAADESAAGVRENVHNVPDPIGPLSMVAPESRSTLPKINVLQGAPSDGTEKGELSFGKQLELTLDLKVQKTRVRIGRDRLEAIKNKFKAIRRPKLKRWAIWKRKQTTINLVDAETNEDEDEEHVKISGVGDDANTTLKAGLTASMWTNVTGTVECDTG